MDSRLTAFLMLLACSSCAIPRDTEATSSAETLRVARMTLEQNHTDQDVEVVFLALGRDEGMKQLTVKTETGVAVLSLSAGESTLGVREFTVESPEPGMNDVLRAYPEGVYLFEGVTLTGTVLKGRTSLSHTLPAPTTIRVDADAGIIHWTAVPGTDHFMVELEQKKGAGEFKLTLEVPGDITSFSIPSTMQAPGEYQVGVGAVSSDGNMTVVETRFTIGNEGRAPQVP